MHQVNRTRRLDITFPIIESPTPTDQHILIHLPTLSDRRPHPPGFKKRLLDLKEFLDFDALRGLESFTVREVINHTSGVQGAVHKGCDKSDLDRAMTAANAGMIAYGLHVLVAKLKDLGEVALDGLADLRAAVRPG